MPLKLSIINIKPRENSGSVSSSRFDYQKDWSICKLIECHQTKTDYLVVFDWHEDLLIMDSESNPEKISFFQIKGKNSGNWTITQLIKSEIGKDGNLLLSIIGKLFDCKTKYELETTSLNFVSNARFKVNLADNSSSLSKDLICIVELTTDDKEKIKKKIIDEHHLYIDPIFEDITFLRVIDLSLHDSKAHTQGKISDFLSSIYGDRKFNIPTIYKLLFDEVKRRSNYHKEILTYNDLLSNKAIGKSQFKKIIDTAGINKNYDEIWNRIEVSLQTKLDFQELKNLKHEWNRLEIERMDPNNVFLINLIEGINSLSKELETTGALKGQKLADVIHIIFNEFTANNKLQVSYNEAFIKAIILSEIYD